PRPAARRVLVTAAEDPAECLSAIRATGAEPSAAQWDGTSLTTVFESIEAAAVEQAELATEAVGGQVTTTIPSSFGGRAWSDGGVGLKVTHRLGALRETLAVIEEVMPGA